MSEKIIMVVDDDIDVQSFCKIVLEREGYKILSFSDSQSALDFLSHNTVSLIITDLMMGGIDEGIQFVNKIRSNISENSRIPIILITGIISKLGYDISPQSEEEKKKMKIDEFLQKPLEPQKLLNAVKKLIEQP